jgi:uncharacterized membrane protein YcaP (DUF421 family)
MTFVTELIGVGRDLTPLQMSVRALLISLFALLLIRIAGRRAAGMKAPFDNITIILLGTVLCQGVVGTAPILSTAAAGLTIVILHRGLGLLGLYSSTLSNFIKGKTIVLYQNGKFIKPSLARSLVTEGDILEEVRLRTQVDSFENVETIYMERNGEVSTVLKNHQKPSPS